MNDFCELIELTASELDEVAGGSGNAIFAFRSIVLASSRVTAVNDSRTVIINAVDNSVSAS